MEDPKCPKCDSIFFEIKQNIVLVHNIHDQNSELFDAIICHKCGTIIHCFNLRLSPDRNYTAEPK